MVYKLTRLKRTNPIELPCKKTMYNSLEEAQDMIRYINETRVSKEIHAYKCTNCGFWHLTHKSK
ncbi:MAG TPA: hypothetical protein PLR88_01715 [Bacteroidales bacterium]|nr:hypothetical protein [Bacteroidales bacterium]